MGAETREDLAPGRPRRRRSGATRALAAVLLALACRSPAPPAAETGAPAPSPAEASATGREILPLDAEARRWVDATLASLTLREAAAQLVVRWIPGAYASPTSPEFLEAAELVDEGVGGLYLSIGSPHAYAAKVNELQERARVPLLFVSDFESGGPGMRIAHLYALPNLLAHGGGTSLPPTMAFGAIDEERFAYEYGRITGEEARAVGVALNFAPVLDVNDNPANPVINTRSFGGDPELVARLGAAFIRGSRDAGLQATAKHFPGHGNTNVDSHVGLPVIDADRERLEAVELVPFRRAVEAGVDAVMSAHIALPGVVGPGEPPATLHPTIMDELLRGAVGFDGLVVTDALTMAAISRGEWGEAPAVLALRAGTDVLLSPPDVGAAIDAVVAAVEDGRLSEARVRASTRRVLEAKARAGLHLDRYVDLDAVDDVVGSGAHLAFADTAAARSITLVRDRDGWVPLAPAARTLSVTFARPVDRVAGRTFDAALGALDRVRLEPDSPPSAYEALGAALERADQVVVGVHLPASAGTGEDALPAPLRSFLRLAQARRPTVLVSFGNPYLLEAFPGVAAYLLAWSGREVMERAAARALLGAEAVTGRLPIELPPDHAIGDGLVRRRGERAAERVARADPEAEELEAPADPRELRDPLAAPPRPGSDRFLWGYPTTASFLEADPAGVGMSADALARVDSLLLAAVADSVTPGAAVAVGRRGRLVRLRGYGWLDYGGERLVTPATLYDLASLTKVVGTTSAVMILDAEGRLSLDDRVVEHLPGWDRGDPRKADVTLRQLLLHRAGLAPFRRWFSEHAGKEAYRAAIYDEPLEAEPGARTAYSDIGVMTMGLVVEAVTGRALDGFLAERVFRPLDMDDTGFLPPPSLLPRIAPTEVDTVWRGAHVHGVVHDENADAMGGVAGHAGLFSTAFDLAVFADMLLRGGVAPPCEPAVGSGVPCTRARPDSVRVLDPDELARYTRRFDADASRALGWDTPAGRSSAGDYFGSGAFGHTGFTGTSVWIDPELELWVVLLTNRVNPTRAESGHIALRRAVHDAAALAIVDRPVTRRERRE